MRTLGTLQVTRFSVSLTPVEDLLEDWNPPVDVYTPPPMPDYLGLSATAPGWLDDLQDSVNGWPGTLPPPPIGPQPSPLTGFGLDPNDPLLPGWLTDAATAAATGQQQRGQGWPAGPTYSPPAPIDISATSWSEKSMSYVVIGGAANGVVVRPLAPGMNLAADQAAVEGAMFASTAAPMTAADWDQWFAANGRTANLTQGSSSALGSMLVNVIGSLGGPATGTAARNKLQSANLLLDRLNTTGNGPNVSQTFTYAQLKSLLVAIAGQDVANEFESQHGVGGMVRVATLHQAGWAITFDDLSRGYSAGVGSGGIDPGPDYDIAPLRIRVNTRISNGTSYSVATASNATQAARLFSAITDPDVTTTATGHTGMDSPLLAALNTPKFKALVRGGLATLQIAGGVAVIGASWGGATPVGIYSITRGLDELFGAASDYVNDNEIGQRSITAWTIDQATGSEVATDRVLLLADITAGSLEGASVMRSAVNQTRAEAQVLRGLTGGTASSGLQSSIRTCLGQMADLAVPGRRLSPRLPLTSTIGGQPIDPADLARMKSAFERNGGTVLQGPEVDAYLLYRAKQLGAANVGGITDNARQILLPTSPTRTAVYEEFIHATQHRTGRVNDLLGKYLNCEAETLLEIEAAEKLIHNRIPWQLPNNEVRDVITRLRQLRDSQGP